MNDKLSPGGTIAQIIKQRKMSNVKLAEELEISLSRLNNILTDKEKLDEEMFHALEIVLGFHRSYWKSLQDNWNK
jgi:plasmid maintenance system antidote protein VapI